MEGHTSNEVNTRLGICEVCNCNLAKYTCPACEVKTCCIQCVTIHKKELKCNGIRNKVSFKQLSKYSNMDLQSDYILMEEITRSVENCKRDPSKNFVRINKQLPFHLFKLRAAATRRGIHLCFLPQSFTRHKENTTFLNWKTQLISWKVEWVFPEAGYIKYIDERVTEDDRLSTILNKFLYPEYCPPELKDHLQYYQSVGYSGVTVLMKAENIKKSKERYYHLDVGESLKENLEGKTIIEFPTIHVIFNHNRNMYNIIDTDSEDDNELEDNVFDNTGKKEFLSIRKRHLKELSKNERKSLIFTNTDISGEDSSSNSDSEVTKKRKQDSNKMCCSGIDGELNILPYNLLIQQQ